MMWYIIPFVVVVLLLFHTLVAANYKPLSVHLESCRLLAVIVE